MKKFRAKRDFIPQKSRRNNVASKALFKENVPYNGPYSLVDWGKRFVEIGDLTEYQAAIELAGSWVEWQRIKTEYGEFRNKYLLDWLAELEVKIRSEAIRALVGVAGSKTPSAAAAGKWLAEGRYKGKQAGRPSKAEIERQAKIQAKIDNSVDEDVARVFETSDIRTTESVN